MATQTFVFGCLAGLILVPTLMMGGTYPVATRALTEDPAKAPAEVGQAYAWNTGGAIVGSLGAGLMLIPLLGLQDTLWVAVTLNLAAAAILVGGRFKTALPVVGLVAMVGAPDWDPRHMNLAPHIYATDLVDDPSLLAKFRDSGSVRFHEEGLGSTVTVVQRMSGSQVLRINGKTDASSQADKLHQGFIGALPLAIADQVEDVLVIGLGSGMTLSSALTFPVERLRVVELLPEVVRGARSFGEQLGDPLDDPRVEILVEDGRHLLMSEQAEYDVIISQPTNLFISGMSTLFTQETFEAMRDNLAGDGVALVWIQGYLVFESDVKTIARTFQEVFPEAHLWNIGPHDLVFTGHRSAFTADAAALEARLASLSASPAVAWSGPAGANRSPAPLPHGRRRPAGLGGPRAAAHRRRPLPGVHRPPGPVHQGGPAKPELGLRSACPPLPRPRRPRRLARGRPGHRGGGADQRLRRPAARHGGDPQHPVGLARGAGATRDRPPSSRSRGTGSGPRPGHRPRAPGARRAAGWRLLASLRGQRGDAAGATAALTEAAARNPSSPYAHFFLARHFAEGELDAARQAFERVVALDPDLPELAAGPEPPRGAARPQTGGRVGTVARSSAARVAELGHRQKGLRDWCMLKRARIPWRLV